MSTLFISYSTKDRPTAEIFYSKLIEMGFQPPFRDDHPDSGIPAGAQWERELYRKLRLCKALIVLVSRNWLDSKWCFAELAYAKAQGKEFFPVLIDDSPDIPSVVAERQGIRFSDSDIWQRLRRGLVEADLAPENDFPWPVAGVDECPYPGLEPFEAHHAGVYFGRDVEILELREQLNQMTDKGEPRLLYVVGASGSGKSSLVKAGLLPRLARKESNRWCVLPTFRWNELRAKGRDWPEQMAMCLQGLWPSETDTRPDWRTLREGYLVLPLSQEQKKDESEVSKYKAAISKAADSFNDNTKDLLVARDNPNATPLLIIDQFEELLSAADDDTVAPFLDFLGCVLSSRRSALRCIATVRTDFLAGIQTRAELIAWKDHTGVYSLPLMKPDRFYDVIRHPAEKVGVTFESDALVDRMVKDTGTNDALPLLAFTLRELYKQYGDDKRFTFDEYETKLGGLEGCLTEVANDLLAKPVKSDGLSQDERERKLYLAFSNHLVRINDKDQFVRRTALWSELPERARPLLQRFIDRRLITSRLRDENDSTSERVVEVAHEALFRRWDKLAGWLDERRDLLRWRADVERDRAAESRQWKGLTSRQLAIARAWPERLHDDVLEHENEWITAASQKARNRRLSLVTATVLFAIVAVAAVFFARESRRQTDVAERNARLAKYGAYDSDLTAVGATWRDEPLEALERLDPGQGILDSEKWPAEYPDFTWHYLRRLAERRHVPVCPASGVFPTSFLAVAPDDNFRIAWSEEKDGQHNAFAILHWQPGMGDTPSKIPGVLLNQELKYLAFSHDGKLLMWHTEGVDSQIWDLEQKNFANHLNKASHLSNPSSSQIIAAFSPTASHLAFVASDNLLIFNYEKETPVSAPVSLAEFSFEEDDVVRLVFAANGGVVFVITDDAFAAIDVRTERQPIVVHEKMICSSPDGNKVIVGGTGWLSSEPPMLIDISGGEPKTRFVFKMVGQKGFAAPSSAVFSSDGRRLAIAYHELDLPGSLAIWDVESLEPLARIPGTIRPREDFLSIAFVNDYSIVTSSRFGWDDTEKKRSMKLWDASTNGLHLPMPPKHADPDRQTEYRVGSAVAFSRRGDLIAGVVDGDPVVWNASIRTLVNGQPKPEGIQGSFRSSHALAFSVDGATIIDDRGNSAQLHKAVRQERGMVSPSYHYPTTSTNERSVAIVDEEIGIRDSADDRWRLIPGPIKAHLKYVCVSPAGNRLACIMQSGEQASDNLRQSRVFLRNTDSSGVWNEVPIGDATPTAIAFSPDSLSLAIATGTVPEPDPNSDSNSPIFASITVWSVGGGLGREAELQTTQTIGRINALAYSPDGKTLASASDGPGYGYAAGYEGAVRLWGPLTGQLRISLKGHTWGATALAFSPDSRKLVSCSENEALLWDSAEWQPAFRIPDAKLSDDGRLSRGPD